jgi:hypothetical protein
MSEFGFGASGSFQYSARLIAICPSRPRSTVLTATPQQSARSSVVVPVRCIAVRKRSLTATLPVCTDAQGRFKDAAGRSVRRAVFRGR